MRNAKDELRVAEQKASEGFAFAVSTEGFGEKVIYVEGRSEAHILSRKYPNRAIWDMDVWLKHLNENIFSLWEDFNEAASEYPAEELGDVQTFGWYGLSSFFPPVYVDEDGATVAAAIVHEDNYGFRDVDTFKTAKEAEEAWGRIEDAYSEFLGEGEEEDAAENPMFLKYLPVNQAWAFVMGDSIISMDDLTGSQRFFQARQEAVKAARRRGLRVAKDGEVSAGG